MISAADFEGKIQYDTVGGCHLWAGGAVGRDHYLYGNLYFQGKRYLAHRAAWTIYRGSIPDGLSVCHKCDVPFCVNPDHLFLGTHKQNMHDMIAKGRNAGLKGSQLTQAKLTEADIPEIRKMRNEGMQLNEIGSLFGVSKNAIHAVVRGRNWLHVK